MDQQHTAQRQTETRATVADLTRKLQGYGDKLHMDNFFPSPDLFGDLTSEKLNRFWTVKTNRKGMPRDLGPTRIQQKWSDIQETTRGQLTAIPRRKRH
jgi:hypothetical protein